MSKSNSNVLLWYQLRDKYTQYHDDVIKWKHFPRYWPFVRGIHRSPRTKASDTKLWCFLIKKNDWVNNREAGDLRRHRTDYCNGLNSLEMHCFRYPQLNVSFTLGIDCWVLLWIRQNSRTDHILSLLRECQKIIYWTGQKVCTESMNKVLDFRSW